MPIDAALYRARTGHFHHYSRVNTGGFRPDNARGASGAHPDLCYAERVREIVNRQEKTPSAATTPRLKLNTLLKLVTGCLLVSDLLQNGAAADGQVRSTLTTVPGWPDGLIPRADELRRSEVRLVTPLAASATLSAQGNSTSEVDINEALFHEFKRQHILARHQKYEPDDKATLIAAMARYAETAAMQNEVLGPWLVATLLGHSPDIALTRLLASNVTAEQTFTVADMQRLLQPAAFRPLLPTSLFPCWREALNQILPWLNHPEVQTLPLCSTEYAALYTGARYLAAAGTELTTLTIAEVAQLGEILWELATAAGGVEAALLPFFALPALFCLAQRQPERVQHPEIPAALTEEALTVCLQARQQAWETLERLRASMQRYIDARQSWQSRGELAETFIHACHQMPSGNSALTAAPPDATDKERIKQRYLNGWEKPCATAPDITSEYEKQTHAVAAHFAELDKLLIQGAMENLEQEEHAFIHAHEAILYPVKAVLAASYNFRKMLPTDRWYQRNLDLLLVSRNHEERIYLLAPQAQGGYQLIRVDREKEKYLRYRIFEMDEKYEKEFITNPARLTLEIKTQTIPAATQRSQQQLIQYIDYLQAQHRDHLYHALYHQGYDPSTLEKIWRVVKAFIPFYECIEGTVKNNVAQAVPACLLDLIAFIPVAGQATLLAGKFGTRLATGLQAGSGLLLRQGLSRPALRAAAVRVIAASRLPTVAEMQSLGKSVLRAADPGIETVISLGMTMRRSLSSLISVLKQINDLPADSKLAKTLQAALNRLSGAPAPLLTGRLADNQAPVAVKPVATFHGREIYVLEEAESGNLARRRYWRDRQGDLQPLNKIELLLTEGLSGRGAPVAASRWLLQLQDNQIQALIMLLRDNPQAIALTGGLNKIARMNHVPAERLMLFINEQGELTPLGLRKVTEVGNITPGVIAQVLSLSRKKFPAGEIAAIAEQYGISRARLEKYISQRGELTPLGEELLRDHEFHKFSREDARRIMTLNRQCPELDAISLAIIFNLDARKVHCYFRANGRLTKAAINRMFYSVNRTTLWELLSKDIGERTPEKLRQYATAHSLAPDAFSRYFHVDGSPTEKLKAFLKLSDDNAARADRLSLPQEAVKEVGDELETAPDYTVSINHHLVRIELTETADLPTGRGTSQEITEMKVSVEDAAFVHRINNNLPILQDPEDPRISLLIQHEGPPEAVKVTHWSSLHHLFRALGRKETAERKNSIHQQIHDWLRHEGDLDNKFTALMYTAVPLDDDGPARGLSVFARQDIAPFTVLGPYAGKLHESEASLNQEARRVGRAKVLTYLWETRAGARTVSGFGTGNILSLINTSKLPGGKAWRHNNVVAIRAGKSLTFYVAAEEIKAGEELLVDYGETYNPAATEIKQEPLSPQPGPSQRAD